MHSKQVKMPDSQLADTSQIACSAVNGPGISATRQFAIRLYITGFGKFRGVPSNPTTVLAERLKAYLTDVDPLPAELKEKILSLSCEVLEASAVGALEALKKEWLLEVTI